MQPYKTDPPIAVLYFCPRLGFEHVPWEAFMTQVLAMGYDGIELGVPASIDERTLDQIWECAWRRSVQLILRHSDTGSADFNEHYDQYGAWWERIKCYPCVNVISDTDRDRFSVEQNRALIALAGPETVQAIHRERFSYSPRVTCEYLLADPDLRLSFDISQWIDGTGSCLDDQIEAVDLAIERSGHIEACSGPRYLPRLLETDRAPVSGTGRAGAADDLDGIRRSAAAIENGPRAGKAILSGKQMKRNPFHEFRLYLTGSLYQPAKR